MFCFLWLCCVTLEKVHSWQLNSSFANCTLYCDPRSVYLAPYQYLICILIYVYTIKLLSCYAGDHFFLLLHLYSILQSAVSAGLYEQDSGMPDTYPYLCCCDSYGPDPNPLQVFGKASIYFSDVCMKSQETFASFLEENCQIMGVPLWSLRDWSLKQWSPNFLDSAPLSAERFWACTPSICIIIYF